MNHEIPVDGLNLKPTLAHHVIIAAHEEVHIEAGLAQARAVISPQGACADNANFSVKRLMRFFHCHGSKFLTC